ncbi:MAG TPA: hypothetical protein VN086_01240 [Candidatus Paceibacterota bacterium]|nr:hypothetical protein [Candidatus Paceibacterota bacterium]
MPGSVDVESRELVSGFETFEESFRNATSGNVVQQLQHAFQAIQTMNPQRLIVAAQTISAFVAMRKLEYMSNPLLLALANAVRQEMLHQIAQAASMRGMELRKRFTQAWAKNIDDKFLTL